MQRRSQASTRYQEARWVTGRPGAMTDVLMERERREGMSSNKGDAVARTLLRSKRGMLPGWRQTDQGGGRFLKVPSSGGQGRGWTGPIGGWVHRAGHRARGGQLAAE